MANSVASNKPFGRIWAGVCLLNDTASTLTLAASGVSVEIVEVTSSLVAGTTSPVVDFNIENANGDIICRFAVGAGGGPGGAVVPVPIETNGIVLRVNDVAVAGDTAAVNIFYRHRGGTAPTEVP